MKRETNQATHTVRTDTLSTDTSLKRIEIDFCRTDHFSECWPGMMNIAEMLQEGISRMVEGDVETVGSQQVIIDIKKCAPIESVGFYPRILKPEYIVAK